MRTAGLIVAVLALAVVLFYVQEGVVFDVGRYGGAEQAHLPPVGQDITGDGKPDLAVAEWTAGAYCCISVYVFETMTVLQELLLNISDFRAQLFKSPYWPEIQALSAD